jgi:hypothetical protein
MTLGPCPQRGAAAVVRPGFSPTRGKASGCCPQASRACRRAQGRGTRVPKSLWGSSHRPRGRRLEAVLSATSPRPPLQTSRQPCLKRARGGHTITPLASAHADAYGEAPSPPHAETEEHLCARVPPGFARPVGWPRCPQGRRGIRRRPLERHGRGVLRPPGGRDGLHRQRFEGDGALHPVQIGRTQRREEVAQPIIRARGPRAPRLPQRQDAPVFPPFPHLREGLLALEHREDSSCNPTPTREHMRRGGWDEAVKHGGACQAPSYTHNHRSRCDGMPLLHGHGHEAPPVVLASDSIRAASSLRQQRVSPPQQKSCGLT